MKNKKRNKKNEIKYQLRQIGFVVFLAVVFIILIISITNKNNIKKMANDENYMVIGNQEIDISQITSATEINPPTLGARNDTNRMG